MKFIEKLKKLLKKLKGKSDSDDEGNKPESGCTDQDLGSFLTGQ